MGQSLAQQSSLYPWTRRTAGRIGRVWSSPSRFVLPAAAKVAGVEAAALPQCPGNGKDPSRGRSQRSTMAVRVAAKIATTEKQRPKVTSTQTRRIRAEEKTEVEARIRASIRKRLETRRRRPDRRTLASQRRKNTKAARIRRRRRRKARETIPRTRKRRRKGEKIRPGEEVKEARWR